MESTAVGVGTLGKGPMVSRDDREAEGDWPRPLSSDLIGGTDPVLEETGMGIAGRCGAVEQKKQTRILSVQLNPTTTQLQLLTII